MSIDTDDLTTLDERSFGARVELHRRELHVHCYRLLGSFDDAEDLVQEAFLRGAGVGPRLAVPHRDQRLPGRAGQATPASHGGR